jgi:hypothetical protein
MPPEVTRGMTDHQPATGHAAAGAHDDSHGTAGHAAADANGAHGHDDMSLGPIDWTVWIVGLAGVAAGAVTAFCFALSTGYLG